MSAKKIFFAGLLGMCWSWGTVQAQGLYPATIPQTPTPKEAAQTGAEIVREEGTGLSSWITYERNNCCTGQGGGMPILTELFVRVGPTFPVGGEFFGRVLNTGWMIEGGGRAMFFNHAWDRAWGVELGISNFYNPSTSTTPIFLDHNINKTVSIRALDRTFANLGLGREWYLWAPANSSGSHLRFGADVGGRYGSATVKFNELRHRTQVIEGAYAAVHTDLEIPCGRSTCMAGIRGEYGFTWSNIFAQDEGRMQDISLIFSFGVRY